MRRLLRWIIVIAVPIVLTMVVVRLLTLPWFPAWAYRRPGFPDDPFAMPREERLRLAQAAIRFLNQPRGSDLLRNLTLPDGSPAFNARELEHMKDVKLVYDRLTLVAAAALTLAIAAGAGLLARREGCAIWGALAQGGGLTLLILFGLGVWMLVGFSEFFTRFHGLFFEPGTWVFSYSDTLIRLFPLPFWRDAGLIVAGVVSFVALGFSILGFWAQRRCL